MPPAAQWAGKLLLAALLLPLTDLELSGASSTGPWSLGVWQCEDGLPNNNVAGLAQTADGYIWVANPSGLVRFDGVRFETFPASSSTDWQQNRRIRLLARSRQDGLWLAVDPGYVIRLEHGAARVFTNDLPQQIIESMIEDGEGSLWVGCHGGALCRIKDGVVTAFGPQDDLPKGASSLAVDDQGRLWFSKGGRIGLRRDGRFVTLLPLGRTNARIIGARGGGIWASSGFELFRYSEKGSLENRGGFREETARGDTSALLEDRTGAVWIGTSTSGLFRYAGSRFESVPTSDREILSLMEDREGNVWVGTGGGGLNRIRPRPVVLEGRDTGAPFESVQSLCQRADGAIVAVTQDGSVVRRSNGIWSQFSTNAALNSVMATCVAADRAGNVWVATGEHKLFRCRDDTVTTWDQQGGLEGRVLHALLPARDGRLWVAEEYPDAVQYLEAGDLHTVEIPSSAHRLRTIAEDNSGNVWLGGDRGTLLRIRGQEVTDVSDLPSEPQKSIRCLRVAVDGSLWMGFSAGGIGRLKDGKFTRVTEAQGLYFDAINQMVSDNRGSVWLGSDRGIFRVRAAELDKVADGLIPALWPSHYGRSEGLPGLQARFGDWPGAMLSRDGGVWIPLRNALAIVHPENLAEDLQPPPVLVSRVLVDDQTVALYGGAVPVGAYVDPNAPAASLVLAPGHRRIEFEFTALSFGPPENVHFQYQLEGFDESWRDCGAVRNAIYSRLPAGNYSFRVRACNSDGIWNERGVSLGFSVSPFFWQRWWFRAGALAGFTLLVAAAVWHASSRRLRARLQALVQQAALDRERARIARDIHDDLGGSLTQVALLSGLAVRDWNTPDKAGAHVQQLSLEARHVIKSLDEIVWAVNPRNDTLPDLISYLSQYAVEFLRAAGIRCRVKAPDHPPPHSMPAEVRHNLFLTVKESLNNIVRHARATEVWLRITATEEALVVAIEDNGCGFTRAPDDPGADGLRNMRQRMEEIGGRFQVDSSPDGGTKVSLNYPLPTACKNGKH